MTMKMGLIIAGSWWMAREYLLYDLLHNLVMSEVMKTSSLDWNLGVMVLMGFATGLLCHRFQSDKQEMGLVIYQYQKPALHTSFHIFVLCSHIRKSYFFQTTFQKETRVPASYKIHDAYRRSTDLFLFFIYYFWWKAIMYTVHNMI